MWFIPRFTEKARRAGGPPSLAFDRAPYGEPVSVSVLVSVYLFAVKRTRERKKDKKVI